MKLTAKGHNPYLEFSHAPDMKAALEAEVMFEAALQAGQSMISMANSDQPVVQKSAVELWMAMRHLHETMTDRLESLELMIQVAGAKLETEYVGALEG